MRGPIEAKDWLSPEQYTTLAVFLGATGAYIVGLVAFDVWTYAKRGNASTLSVVLGIAIRDFPVLFLALSGFLGAVVGHIAWPRSIEDPKKDANRKG
jgi:hypothetical protein